MPAPPIPKLRLAIVNDYEIVVAGVRAMLEGHPELTLVQLDRLAVDKGSVDVVLYDNFAQSWQNTDHLEDLIDRSQAKVVVFTWTVDQTSVSRALAAGAAGYLSKGLTADEIASALQAIHRGEAVVSPSHVGPETSDRATGAWPGQADGLSSRESEILALITQGLSNSAIASATYLSINSVKTYIRTAYRKLGVQSRTQAVRYGMRHGFDPERTSAVR